MYGCWFMHEITLIGWPVTSGRDYQPITSTCGATVPTVIPMLLSNAQILRRGHAAGGWSWSRSEDTHEECNRARALSTCPLQSPLALVVFLNVPRAAVTESPTQLAVVDQRSCGRDAPPKWNLPATTRLQQVGAQSGDENCLRANSWRTWNHCCPRSTTELTANFFWTAAVVAVDRLPRSMMHMLQFSFVLCALLRAHGSARHHNNTHAYFVSGWGKEAERDDHFRTAPTENSGPKFKFRLLRSLVKLITFQNFKPKRVNKSEMLQNFSQTQGTVFHSSACISSSEGFFKNRSAHFCGKSPSFGACPSQIAILLSLWLKFLMKWKPTYIYGGLNFSDSQQVFANLFSWRKLEGSLIVSWKFQGRTPQEIWITAVFPARSLLISYDAVHHAVQSSCETKNNSELG